MKVRSISLIVLLLIGVTACEYEKIEYSQTQVTPSPMDAAISDDFGAKKSAHVDHVLITSEFLDEINEFLASEGMNYRVLMAETLTEASSGEVGMTIRAKYVGNKQLGADFVPDDERRAWSSAGGNEITYAIDQTLDAVPPIGGLSAADTDAAIVRGINTWDEVGCSNFGLIRFDDFGLDIGYVAYVNNLGGSPFVFADIQFAGWRDINFQAGVLGATFTYIWIDNSGVATDIDNNKKGDVAFREIYFDPSYPWADDGVSNADVESVALHEFGHGLSQGHFGIIVYKNSGESKAMPRAVMNSIYFKPYRELQGTDIAGNCSIWGSWPNN